MADQATDVNAADESFDLGSAMLEESSSTQESSTEKPTETTGADETTEKPEAKPADTQEDAADDSSAESEESDEEETPKRDAEARKQQLNAEIRELVATKKQKQAEIEAMNAQVYRTQTADELVEEGYDPYDAEKEADRQAQEMRDFNRDVTDLNQAIDIEVAQVMQDFAWSDPQSSDYDETTAQAAYELLQKAGQPQIDEKTGLVTRINVMPYEIYQAFDSTRRSSTQTGQVEGRKASAKMLAAVEPRSSAPAAQSVEEDDPFMAGFNKVK